MLHTQFHFLKNVKIISLLFICYFDHYTLFSSHKLCSLLLGWANTPDGVKYRVIELPYHGNHTSMFIAFPSERVTPLSTILPHLTTATVHDWAQLMRQGKMRLLLPK